MSSFANVAGATLLRPVIALNVWTLAMEAWMYATRIPAISAYNVKVAPETTKEEMNRQIPAHIRWKADNYNHLLEQPTQFYAVAIVLALVAPDDDLNATLAWAYVGTRVVHSLVQSLTNIVLLRFGVFAASSLVLTALTGRAAMLLF